MSMYEIEGLVESSIRTLHQSKNKDLDKRNIIWNLYNNVQYNFDCSFTHFRVMDILLEYSFAIPIEVHEHPDYKNYKAYFDDLKEKDFEHIKENPLEKWDGENNLTTSYYSNYNHQEGKIYFDYGSPFWNRIFETDKSKPVNLDFFELGLLMMREAEKLGDTSLIYEWYGFTINFYSWYSKERDFEKLKQSYFIEMKDIFLRSRANENIPEHHPSHHVHNQEELKEILVYFDEDLSKVMSWFIKF